MLQEENLANRKSLRQLSKTAILFALSLVLAYTESFLPPLLPGLPLRYGFSNIPLMLLILNSQSLAAFSLVLLKSLLVLMTRGGLAALLSLCGGLLSLLSMSIMFWLCPKRMSLFAFSSLGAIMHNLGQLCVIKLTMGISTSALLKSLFPLLILLGLASGLLTALLLNLLLPYFLTHSLTESKSKA
ncbi:MAG: Gx transporter family protein [Eubacteriales bacterium]|nr:Gx transporter family protein [Eubacteriales bacterium]